MVFFRMISCPTKYFTCDVRVAIVSPSDPVQVAAKRMRELRVNSVVIMTSNKIQGILTWDFLFIRIPCLFFSFSFLSMMSYIVFRWTYLFGYYWLMFIISLFCLTTVLQFKRHPYACCSPKSISRANSGGKGAYNYYSNISFYSTFHSSEISIDGMRLNWSL